MECMSGFLKYTPKYLAKINSIRRAVSQPDIYTVPTLDKASVLFVSAAEMHNEPASCYNCRFYNYGKSCGLIGALPIIRKFTYGAPDKEIEYWPCCGAHEHGAPNYGVESYRAANSPTTLGLLWINAPKRGLDYGGANCGGSNGGDDCDFYMTDVDDKRSAPTGFCRVLQSEVANGDVCAAWIDDDRVTWQQAQAILKEQGDHGDTTDPV
jgi:hypothetical protein